MSNEGPHIVLKLLDRVGGVLCYSLICILLLWPLSVQAAPSVLEKKIHDDVERASERLQAGDLAGAETILLETDVNFSAWRASGDKDKQAVGAVGEKCMARIDRQRQKQRIAEKKDIRRKLELRYLMEQLLHSGRTDRRVEAIERLYARAVADAKAGAVWEATCEIISPYRESAMPTNDSELHAHLTAISSIVLSEKSPWNVVCRDGTIDLHTNQLTTVSARFHELFPQVEAPAQPVLLAIWSEQLRMVVTAGPHVFVQNVFRTIPIRTGSDIQSRPEQSAEVFLEEIAQVGGGKPETRAFQTSVSEVAAQWKKKLSIVKEQIDGFEKLLNFRYLSVGGTVGFEHASHISTTFREIVSGITQLTQMFPNLKDDVLQTFLDRAKTPMRSLLLDAAKDIATFRYSISRYLSVPLSFFLLLVAYLIISSLIYVGAKMTKSMTLYWLGIIFVTFLALIFGPQPSHLWASAGPVVAWAGVGGVAWRTLGICIVPILLLAIGLGGLKALRGNYWPRVTYRIHFSQITERYKCPRCQHTENHQFNRCPCCGTRLSGTADHTDIQTKQRTAEIYRKGKEQYPNHGRSLYMPFVALSSLGYVLIMGTYTCLWAMHQIYQIAIILLILLMLLGGITLIAYLVGRGIKSGHILEKVSYP